MRLIIAILLTAASLSNDSLGAETTTLKGHKDANDVIQAVKKTHEDPTPMVNGNSSNLGEDICYESLFFQWVCEGDLLCCSRTPASYCCPVLPCCSDWCCTEEGYHCCTGGEPGCCPDDYKCCEDDKCCPEGSECCKGDTCCPEGTECCDDGTCCKEGTECCGPQCCIKDVTECNKEQLTCCPKDHAKTCSATNVCCEDKDCCGDNCGCDSGQSCCNDDSCCDDASSSCCPKGCNGCKYPWSALPCTSSTSNVVEVLPTADTCPTPGSVNGSIYRILRKDESCDKGLLAQQTSGQSKVTPKQHLACINDSSIFPNSPFITFSSDPKSLEKLIGEFSSLNLTLAKVDQSKIPSGCTSIDLTTDANRNKYLQGDQRAMTFAKDWCPILVECGKVPIPCTVQPKHI